VMSRSRSQLRQQVRELAQLLGEQLAVPPGVQRDLVVGQRQRALLGLAQVRKRHYWDVRQSKLERRQVATVPRKDRPVLVGEDRVCPAKTPDAVADLLELFLWVGPRIPFVRTQTVHGEELDFTKSRHEDLHRVWRPLIFIKILVPSAIVIQREL
jgi:hypothetical protein